MNRNKGTLILVLCLVCFFTSCVNKKQEGSIWKIIDVDFKRKDYATAGLSHNNCFLNITPDNLYVFYLNGYFSEGMIVQAGDSYKMLRKQDNKVVATFKAGSSNRGEGKLNFSFFDTTVIQKTRNADEVAHSFELPVEAMAEGFIVDVETEKRSKNADLYAPGYNQWRVKPNRKETDLEIKNRVKNHVEFMQAYFENALDLGLQSVSEPNLASPFEVYSNGISMRKFEEIQDWQDLFFNKEEAKKGYDIINNEMKKKFTLIKTKNAFELNADIFRKILKVMD